MIPDNSKAPGPKTPGPRTPGPKTPGPRTPGPKTPGPRTPGPRSPGPKTPGPEDVLAAINAELADPSAKISALRDRLDGVRWAIERFRAEPVGGRLSGLKSMAYWFVASSFDRQAKILEAMADLLEDTMTELEMIVGGTRSDEKTETIESTSGERGSGREWGVDE